MLAIVLILVVIGCLLQDIVIRNLSRRIKILEEYYAESFKKILENSYDIKRLYEMFETQTKINDNINMLLDKNFKDTKETENEK